MKEITSKLPITTLIIIYLFICGGLYMTGYWSTFKVDPFSLADIWEIPKKFIMPFMYTSGALLVSIILTSLFYHNFSRFSITPFYRFYIFIKRDTLVFKIIMLCVYLSFITATILAMNNHKFLYNKNFWSFSLVLLAFILFVELNKINYFERLIPQYSPRFMMLWLISFNLVDCFLIGKQNSLSLYHQKNKSDIVNISKEYNTITTMPEKDSLKLLGFLGDKVIVSSLDNSKIWMLNKSVEIIEVNTEMK